MTVGTSSPPNTPRNGASRSSTPTGICSMVISLAAAPLDPAPTVTASGELWRSPSRCQCWTTSPHWRLSTPSGPEYCPESPAAGNTANRPAPPPGAALPDGQDRRQGEHHRRRASLAARLATGTVQQLFCLFRQRRMDHNQAPAWTSSVIEAVPSRPAGRAVQCLRPSAPALPSNPRYYSASLNLCGEA